MSECQNKNWRAGALASCKAVKKKKKKNSSFMYHRDDLIVFFEISREQFKMVFKQISFTNYLSIKTEDT